MSENLLMEQARELFGEIVVLDVIEVVEMSDPDGAYTYFDDMGMFDHAECVEFLYF